jgi:hypothetical protein
MAQKKHTGWERKKKRLTQDKIVKQVTKKAGAK